MAHGSRGSRTLRTRRLPAPVRGVLLSLALLTGCGGEPPALAVGPAEFEREDLGVLGSAQQETLVELTALGLVVAEGRVDELIRPHVERDLRSIVLQRLALELAASQTGVGEAQLRRYYGRNPHYELVVRHLVVLSERWRPPEHRDSAWAVAREALERARSGASFEALAAEYSDEPGAAERGGLLEPGRRGSWVPEFWEAASELEVGEISPVVETEYGFHVIRLEERRPVPFEEVRESVLNEVMDLPSALGRAGSWAERRMAVARVDTSAVRAWRADSAAVGPLVRWPDSLGIPALAPDDVDRYASTLPAAPGDEGAMSPEAALDLVTRSAQTHMMMHRAEERGIAPSASQRVAIRERWRDRVLGWAGALGFAEGDPVEVVEQKALQAVGATAQSAAIARSELPAVSRRLRELYPVRRNESVGE